MVTIIPPPTPRFPHSRQATNSLESSPSSTNIGFPGFEPDFFHGLNRNHLINALKNPVTFEAVLNVKAKSSPAIEALRKQLQKQKISAKEFLAHPEIRINFYEHMTTALLTEFNQKGISTDKKSMLLNEAIGFKNTANSARKTLGKPISSLKSNFAQISKTPNQTPKFGGWFISLFTNASKFMIDNSPFEDYKCDYRAYNFTQRKKLADKIINGGSFTAAAAAFGLNKLVFADDAVLTGITVNTIFRMGYGVYGIDGASESTVAVILGKLLGARFADGMVDYALEKGLNFVPVLGEIASSTSTFVLHQTTARLFKHYFEYQISKGQKPGLPDSLNALTSFIRLMGSSGVNFDGDVQETHYNKLNITRAITNDDYNFIGDIRGGSLGQCIGHHLGNWEPHEYSIINIMDKDGNIIGHPSHDDLVNRGISVLAAGWDIRKLTKAVAKHYDLKAANSVIQDIQSKGKLTGKQADTIIRDTNDLLSGTKTLAKLARY